MNLTPDDETFWNCVMFWWTLYTAHALKEGFYLEHECHGDFVAAQTGPLLSNSWEAVVDEITRVKYADA